MALKQDSAHFVVCPKQGDKLRVLSYINQVSNFMIFFFLNRVRGFKPSAAHLYPIRGVGGGGGSG